MLMSTIRQVLQPWKIEKAYLCRLVLLICGVKVYARNFATSQVSDGRGTRYTYY